MTTIRVAVRLRPELKTEGVDGKPQEKACVVINKSTGEVLIRREKGENGGGSAAALDVHQYSFDRVFDAHSTQEEVFSSVKDMVDESLKGYNVTIFAFGQTGSGKTFTISGGAKNPGIVPRTVHHVFSDLRKHAEKSRDNVAMVFLSFVELYNNSLYDLLAPDIPSSGEGSGGGGLKILEHPTKGTVLQGSPTLRTPVSSAEEALQLINKGYKLRATAATNLNERSSRSHTVITLEVVSRSAEGRGSTSEMRFGKINLVDLAGSENVKMSGAEGQTLEEAKNINKALSVLGDVLNSLSKYHSSQATDGNNSPSVNASSATAGCGAGDATSKMPHVPYRNSKLTMLLKDSLGGNAKTMMIATVRSLASFYTQSLTSLKYAARARRIRCNPVLNIGMSDDGESNSMQKTLSEVARLKGLLESSRNEFNAMRLRLQALEESREAAAAAAIKAEGGGSSHAEEAERKSGGNGSVSATDAAAAAVAAAAAAAEVEEYRQKIFELQDRSAAERKELQEAMRHVIYSHESEVAVKEREFVSLELQLQQQISKAESLSRDKDSALESKKQAEMTNMNLHARLRSQQAEISQLEYENDKLKRELTNVHDELASKEMSVGDKSQFVEALQKLTLSRSKHKTRSEELEALVKRFTAEAEGLRSTITDLQSAPPPSSFSSSTSKSREAIEEVSVISAPLVAAAPPAVATSSSSTSTNKNKEGVDIATYEALKSKYKESDKLMAAAALRIEELEAKLKAEKAEKSSINEAIEVNARLEAVQKAEAERVAEAHDISSRELSEAALLAAQAETKQAMALEASTAARLAEAEEMLRVSQESSKIASLALADKNEEVVALKAAVALLQSNASVQSMQKRNEEVQRAAEWQLLLDTERANHAKEVVALRAAAAAAAIAPPPPFSSTSSSVGGSDSKPHSPLSLVVDPPSSLRIAEGEESPESMLSPDSENRALKSTIAALRINEREMFGALENKLKDLDEARTKLIKLKALTSTTSRSDAIPNMIAEALEEKLSASDKQREALEAELHNIKVLNSELMVRLASKTQLLEQERIIAQRQQEELDLARREKAEDIAAVAAMVKTHVQADQDRRLNEILHHSIDRSFETTNSDSVEEEDAGGVVDENISLSDEGSASYSFNV